MFGNFGNSNQQIKLNLYPHTVQILNKYNNASTLFMMYLLIIIDQVRALAFCGINDRPSRENTSEGMIV